MVSKKIIFGSIASVAIVILVISTLPIIIYGYTVNVVEIDTSFKISSSGNSSPSLSSNIKISQESPVKFSVGNPSVQVNQKTMNAYEYIMAKGAGLVDTSEEVQSGGDGVVPSGGAEVELNITFNFTNWDTGIKLNYTEDLRDFSGIGVKHIKALFELDPGNYTLMITISIKITPPSKLSPIVKRSLKPIYREFEVPEEPNIN